MFLTTESDKEIISWGVKDIEHKGVRFGISGDMTLQLLATKTENGQVSAYSLRKQLDNEIDNIVKTILLTELEATAIDKVKGNITIENAIKEQLAMLFYTKYRIDVITLSITGMVEYADKGGLI